MRVYMTKRVAFKAFATQLNNS